MLPAVLFLLRQFPNLPSGEAAQRQLALPLPLQIGNGHAPGCHHPAYLMILSLADGDAALSRAQGFQLRRQAHRAVPQSQPGGKGLHRRLCGKGEQRSGEGYFFAACPALCQQYYQREVCNNRSDGYQ